MVEEILKRKWKIWVEIAVVGGAVIAIALTGRQPDPVYQGKQLSEWFKDVPYAIPTNSMRSDFVDINSPAAKAILAMEGDAVPFLTSEFQSSSSKLQRWIAQQEEQYLGVKGALYALGERKLKAYFLLKGIGPKGSAAMPVLCHMAVNSWDRNDAIDAIELIAHIHSNPELAIPVLRKLLDEPDQKYLEWYVYALEMYGPAAKDAVPALAKFYQGAPASSFRKAALIRAIEKLDPLGIERERMAMGRIKQ